MRAIILVMLAVQAAILLVTIWKVLFKRQAPGSRRPVWSGLAIALAIIAGTSIRIADSHAGQPGADVLSTGAALLLGMALMTVLIALRERKGLA
jgi:hypothetical protein